jgi:hypothetical protein
MDAMTSETHRGSGTNTRRLAIAWLVTLAGCSSVAPEKPTRIGLSWNDVSFYQYSFEEESRFWNAACGFLIQGNSYSWQIPRPGWAISVYEVMDNDRPVVRVDAAAFRVVSNEPKAPVETRPPITALTFTLQGRRQSLTAKIVGQSNPQTGEINATLETAPAQEVFQAFYYGKPIEISLTYRDGATEVLEVRNWWVAKLFDPPTRHSFTTDGDYVQQCVKSLHRAPAGAQYVIYQLGPLPITNRGGLHPENTHLAGPIGWWTPPGSFCFGPHGEPGRCGTRE